MQGLGFTLPPFSTLGISQKLKLLAPRTAPRSLGDVPPPPTSARLPGHFVCILTAGEVCEVHSEVHSTDIPPPHPTNQLTDFNKSRLYFHIISLYKFILYLAGIARYPPPLHTHTQTDTHARPPPPTYRSRVDQITGPGNHVQLVYSLSDRWQQRHSSDSSRLQPVFTWAHYCTVRAKCSHI